MEVSDEGDFLLAIERYTAAITLNRNNHVLFSNRSAAYARVGKFAEALEDAKRCHELKPDWPKGYYRLGVAYQGLDMCEDAMAAYAEGLVLDPKQGSMLNGLVEAMLRSPYRGNFGPKYEKFESLKLEKNPFIITSVIGQELQSVNRPESAVKILEAARLIGTDSVKLEASLMQALGRVHWLLGNTEKALLYMEKDLEINSSLKDYAGCCRARDNLGIAYFSLGRYEEAVRHHSEQLTIARERGELLEIINSLTRLGNAYSKQGDNAKALKVYKDSLKLSKESGDQVLIARAFSNLGKTQLSNNDVDKAIMWHHQHLTFAKESSNKLEEAEAYGHLGHACFVKGNYEQSMMFYQQLLSVAVQINDMTLKARAYGGMGHANKAMGNLWHAQSCREQQLKLCKDMGDEEGQASALSHLGHIHKAAGKLSQAMHFYSESLHMAQKLKDRSGEGRAYANLGSCHIALGNYRDAVGFYQQELTISQETKNRSSEATTLGHLGTAYLALDNLELAQQHMKRSLKMAQDIQDRLVECQALSNLGYYHTSNKEYADALPYLERALKLAQEQKDHANESKICHNLALCYEALGQYQQAIQYYQHDFMVAKEAQDKEGMTHACEKLVRAHAEIGDKEQSEIYRRKVHTIAEDIQNTSGKCTFWNQIAEDALSSGDNDRAIEYYENLLKEAKKEQHQAFEGLAYCGLGNAYLSRGDYEHAHSYHRRDLNIRKATGDIIGECHAYGNMGAASNALNQHQQAVDCYEHELTLAKQLSNTVLVTKAYGCLGIVHRNMKNFQKALEYHQLQLSSALELRDSIMEQASAYANLGDSFEAVGDYQGAVKHHDQHLMLAQQAQDEMVQIRALSSLGRAHRGLGNLRRALFFFEQQLKLAKGIADEYIEAECYADKGGIQMYLSDYSGALESFSCQLQLSRQLQDAFSEALAACGLGEVHGRLGNHREAIDYHKLDLRISSAHQFVDGEARALGNIAETYELIGEYKSAIEYREKQLTAADVLQDGFVKALAFVGLGKVHIKIGEYNRAITLLKQALSLIVDKSTDTQQHAQIEIEAEAKIRFYLGQAFYYQCHYDAALVYLQKALPLFEHMRQHVGHYDHATKQLLELYPILFQTLVNTLVKQGKVEEALEMAEMERNRAVAAALLHHEVSQQVLRASGLLRAHSPNSSWIQEAINTIQTQVLYLSVALNHVFIWLLHPKSGVVQFQKVDMTDFNLPGSDNASVYSETSASYVQPLVDSVSAVREALGIEHRLRLSAKSISSGMSDDFDSGEDSESFVGSSSSMSAPPPAFRQVKAEAAAGKTSPRQINMQPIHELYDILIKPVEYALPRSCGGSVGRLTIIPDKELYLVPFSLLKGEGMTECLYERFHLQFAPSLQSLTMAHKSSKVSPQSLNQANTMKTKAQASVSASVEVNGSLDREPLVVGCPAVPLATANSNWQSLKGVEKEAKLIADLLHSSALLYHSASKDHVLEMLGSADSVHFATHVSWSRCELVLAPPDNRRGGGAEEEEEEVVTVRNEGGLPDPSHYVLTASEIMEKGMAAKLVVLSAAHRSNSPRVPSKGLMCMAQVFLAAGAECVMLPLWPASFQASRLMMNAFYSSLIYGSKASRALRYAMQVVHTSGKYGHPSNWAGYMLLGKDVVLRDRSVDLANSLRRILHSPSDNRILALRTLQTMIASSLKRIAQADGLAEPKYTSQQAVEGKVGSVEGWRDLLSYTGFHFIGAMKDVPATIVFPEHDDSGLQRKALRHLEALLGLPQGCIQALATLSKHSDVAAPLLSTLQSAKVSLESPDGFERGVHVKLEKEVWGRAGCREFLQKLNFEASQQDVRSPWVTLCSPAVKLDRKTLHFATTAIIAVFALEAGLQKLTVCWKNIQMAAETLKALERPLHIQTPLLRSRKLSEMAGCSVWLKLENVQNSGSFKVRGLGHHCQQVVRNGCTQLVSSSGGNAGLAAIYCAQQLHLPITVVVPETTPTFIADKMREEGATVEIVGRAWDEANVRAQEIASQPGANLIHPFDHPDIWYAMVLQQCAMFEAAVYDARYGHASMVEEMKEQLHDVTPDLVVVSVGGGGLMNGVLEGLHRVGWPDVPVLAIETQGADSLNACVKAGEWVALDKITSIARCLGAKRVCKASYEWLSRHPVISHVISDTEAVTACVRVADDHRILVPPSCGASLAAVYGNSLTQLQSEGTLPSQLHNIVIVVCGGNGVNLDTILQWRKQYGIST